MRRVATVALFVLALAVTARYISVTWVERISAADTLPGRGLVMSDFSDAVWLPAKDLLAGFDPYNDAAFLVRHPGTQGYSPYTPGHLLLAAGLGALGWSTASLVWAVLGGVAIAAMGAWTGAATLRFARPAATTGELVAAAACGVLAAWVWRPTSTALGLGQPTSVYGPAAAVAAAATVIPFALGVRARSVLSALAFLKPQTGIQLAITAAAARQWRALAIGFAAAAAASLAVAVWISGSGVVGWVLGLPGAVAAHHSRYDQAFTAGNPWIDVLSTAHRLGLPDVVGLLVAAVLLAVGFAAAVALRRGDRPALGALTAMTTGLLVVPHCGYDVVLLLPVLALATVETVRAPVRTAVVALVPLVLTGLLPNFRLPVVPGGLEPALGQAVLLLAALGLLVAAAARIATQRARDVPDVANVAAVR